MRTSVVFRKWSDGGIIALFPYMPWNRSGGMITSYMHEGQHGPADYAGVIAGTRPATGEEYRDLLTKLESIGYKNPRILIRVKTRFNHKKTARQWKVM